MALINELNDRSVYWMLSEAVFDAPMNDATYPLLSNYLPANEIDVDVDGNESLGAPIANATMRQRIACNYLQGDEQRWNKRQCLKMINITFPYVGAKPALQGKSYHRVIFQPKRLNAAFGEFNLVPTNYPENCVLVRSEFEENFIDVVGEV